MAFGWAFSAYGTITDWAMTALGSADIEPPLTGALRAFLMDDTYISSALGADANRIRPLRLPQKPTLPTIVLNLVSDVGGTHLRGVNALSKARYTVDCWGTNHDSVSALGAYCGRRLDGFTGRWTTTSSPSQSISVTVFQENKMDLFEEEIQGGLCRHSSDYFLYHRLAS